MGSFLTAWLVGVALLLQAVAAVAIRRLGRALVSAAPVLAFAAAALALAAPGRCSVRCRCRRAAGRRAAAPAPAPGRGGTAAAHPGRLPARDLEARIAAAGRPGGLGPRELMAARRPARWPAVAGYSPRACAGRLGLALIVAGPAAGWPPTSGCTGAPPSAAHPRGSCRRCSICCV